MIKREAQAHIVYENSWQRADTIVVFFNNWLFGHTSARYLSYKDVPDRTIVGQVAGSIISRGPTGNSLNRYLCDNGLREMIK
jgi:hypothetical protein